jgi:thiamine-monophosphate kinase
MLLAVTSDSVVEEILTGLYEDLYLAGWMTVTASLSDLAAVGADPLGILINESLPPDLSGDDLERLQAGIGDAAREHGVPVLGGDTNAAPHLQLTGTAIGMVARKRHMTRRGARPGDLLFASGAMGLGSAFAAVQLMETAAEPASSLGYQPIARLREGRTLCAFASSCMDTSDGVIPTLDELMRVNDVGIRIDRRIEDYLHPAALTVAASLHLPPWTMLAGPHGEFELLFTVPRQWQQEFLQWAAGLPWTPIEIGEVVAGHGLDCLLDGRLCVLDAAAIRNLLTEVGGNVERYANELVRLGPT